MQFPLLFPKGDSSFEPYMPRVQDAAPQQPVPVTGGQPAQGVVEVTAGGGTQHRRHLSASEYFCFRMQDRLADPGGQHLLRGRRLLQEFMVMAFCHVEMERLGFIRHNQDLLRHDILAGVQDAVQQYDTQTVAQAHAARPPPAPPPQPPPAARAQAPPAAPAPAQTQPRPRLIRQPQAPGAPEPPMGRDVGRPVILPASYTGSLRWRQRKYMDSMVLVREFGHPDLFLTMTCNPQ